MKNHQTALWGKYRVIYLCHGHVSCSVPSSVLLASMQCQAGGVLRLRLGNTAIVPWLNFFLLSHTVKYFLPLVCRYLLRRFEKCRFYFFGSLLCPSVLHSRLCPVLLLCRHASFFFTASSALDGSDTPSAPSLSRLLLRNLSKLSILFCSSFFPCL